MYIVDIKYLCGNAVLHVLHHSNSEVGFLFWGFIFLAWECVRFSSQSCTGRLLGTYRTCGLYLNLHMI